MTHRGLSRVMRGRLTALITATTLSVPVYATTTVGSDAAYEAALQSFHQYRLNYAIIEVKNALQADPDHLPSQILLAQILVVVISIALVADLAAGAEFTIESLLREAGLLTRGN